MFRNYLKVALRNLWKSKGFTAINIIGLAAGLTALAIALLTVSIQTIRAAVANPIRSLRSE